MKCIGCERDPKVLKPSERCPCCEYHMGVRLDFPSFSEFNSWQKREALVIQ